MRVFVVMRKTYTHTDEMPNALNKDLASLGLLGRWKNTNLTRIGQGVGPQLRKRPTYTGHRLETGEK